MNALHLLVRMAENNAWSNLRLHRACAALDAADYRAKRTSFFPSIQKTLDHIYRVDVYYVDALVRGGVGRSIFAKPEPLFDALPPLADAQRALDRKLVAFVRGLTGDDALDERVTLQRATHAQHEAIGDVLQHLFVHQIHHRGQAHAMLAGTPIAPPQLDDFFLTGDLPLREADLREIDLPIR
jgi:uncharacterized damage-inducible protein DinB